MPANPFPALREQSFAACLDESKNPLDTTSNILWDSYVISPFFVAS
jgi:hypothetical protein